MESPSSRKPELKLVVEHHHSFACQERVAIANLCLLGRPGSFRVVAFAPLDESAIYVRAY